METIVVVLMILVCFNFMMKQTFRKRGSVAAIAVVAALFVGLMCPYAIQQSKTQIADWLADAQLMLDTSVVLTVEVALQMAFCMLAVHVLTTGPVKKRTLWAYRALRWFPGILIFPVLFSGWVDLIFSCPGVSFSRVAWSMAVGVLILISVSTTEVSSINWTSASAILHATREKETPGKEKIRYTNPLNKTGNIKIPGNQRKAR